jgi:hypothetical protein
LAAKRVVEYEEAQAYAEDNGLLFLETSAKSSMNVNEIFLAIGLFEIFWFFFNIYIFLISSQ